MKRKVLAILLALTLLLGMMPTAVFAADGDVVAAIGDVTYTSLQEAFDAAKEQEDATVLLIDDTAIDERITAAFNGIFDLGGHTLDLGFEDQVFNVRDKSADISLTIQNGTFTASGDFPIALWEDVTFKNCKIEFTEMNVNQMWGIYNSGTLTLGEGVDISLTGSGLGIAAVIGDEGSQTIIDGATITAKSTRGDSYGVYMAWGGTAEFKSGTIIGNSKTNGIHLDEDAEFNMTGGTLKDCGTGVLLYGEGTFNMTGGEIVNVNIGFLGYGANNAQYTTIDLAGNAKVVSDGIGIYQPQNGEINISDNAYLEGESAIGIKSGSITMTGGTLYANGTYDPNPGMVSSGIAVDGSTIIVDDQGHKPGQTDGYYGDININISGGELIADYAHNISVIRATNTVTTVYDPPVINVDGGTFKSAENTFRIMEENGVTKDMITASAGIVLKNGEADLSVEFEDDAHNDAGYLAGEYLTVDRKTGEIHNIKVDIADSFGGTVTATPNELSEDNASFTLTAVPQSADYVLAGLTITDADGKTIVVAADGSITDNSDGCITVTESDGDYTVASHCDITVTPVFVTAENNSVIEQPVISIDTSGVEGIEDEHLEDTSVVLPQGELENILNEVNDTMGMEDARQALEEAGILPADSTEEVYLQIATEIKVVVLAYDDQPNTPNILQLEITPYYHVFATTSPNTPVVIGEEQGDDFVLLDSSEYHISGTNLNISMTIPLTESFAAEGSVISIEHEHMGHNYFASARIHDGAVTFRNRHGFSVFTFTVDTTAGLDDLQVLDPERDLIYPLNPDFDTDVFDYEVYVLNYVDHVQVQPTVDAEGITITVNGVVVASGDWSGDIPLQIGKNVITVIVSDGDDESSLKDSTYTIIIYRAGPDNSGNQGGTVLPENPENPETPDKPNTPGSSDKSPETGRNVYIGSMLFLLAVTFAGVEFIIKKRRLFGAESK